MISSIRDACPACTACGTLAGMSTTVSGVARDIYRYQPLVLTLTDLEMIHGANERMTLANLRRMIEFYARLIATAAG